VLILDPCYLNGSAGALRLFRMPFSGRFRKSSADSDSTTAIEAHLLVSQQPPFRDAIFFNRAILSRSASASALWDKSVFW